MLNTKNLYSQFYTVKHVSNLDAIVRPPTSSQNLCEWWWNQRWTQSKSAVNFWETLTQTPTTVRDGERLNATGWNYLKERWVDLKNYFYSCQHIFWSFPSTAHSTIMPLSEWLVTVQTQGLLIYSFKCLLADKHLAAPIKSLGEFPSTRLEIQLRIPNMHKILFFLA